MNVRSILSARAPRKAAALAAGGLLCLGAAALASAPEAEPSGQEAGEASPATSVSHVEELPAPDRGKGDRFGYSVARSGSLVVVGSPSHRAGKVQSGAAYVFEWEKGKKHWRMAAKLVPASGGHAQFFGSAVSISGDVVAVGAPRQGAGAVHVYQPVQNGGGENTWKEVARLIDPDAGREDQFGTSVSIDGETIAVGAPFASNEGKSTGSVTVFRRTGDAWKEAARLAPGKDATEGTGFGTSVSVRGDAIAVGAFREHAKGSFSGAVYVFSPEGGNPWGRSQRLVAADSAANDFFGSSVALGGDLLVIGAPGDDDKGRFTGSAYVFSRGDDGWRETTKLLAGDAKPGDRFGDVVSLGDSLVIVGARHHEGADALSGAAYVFRKGGPKAWRQTEKLLGHDSRRGDRFGASVSVAGDDLAVVGAPQHDEDGIDSGGAYVFRIPVANAEDTVSATH